MIPTAKEKAEKALSLRKVAVLEVLFFAHQQNEERLKQSEIREKPGFGINPASISEAGWIRRLSVFTGKGTSMKSERMAEIGLELLQAAVLECLRKAKEESLTPAQISNRLGIPPAPPIHSGGRPYYHAVHDAVRQLEKRKLIKRNCIKNSSWQICESNG